VAAKVYYQLGEYNESMTFALGAGKLFNIDHPGEFEDTILGTWLPCIWCRGVTGSLELEIS